MPHNATLQYPTARVLVDVAGPVATGRVAGVITPRVAAAVVSDALRWSLGGAQVNVACYHHAGLALGLDHLLRAAARQTGRPAGQHVAPAAIVATAEQLPLFAAYCAAAGDHGIIKRVFLTMEQAQRWAAELAQCRP